MTTEEAEVFVCPYFSTVVAYNTEYKLCEVKCIHDRCMAWQWTRNYDENNEWVNTTSGYCQRLVR